MVKGIKGLDLISSGDGELNDNGMISINFDSSAFDLVQKLAEKGELFSVQVIINGRVKFTVEEITDEN